MWQKWRELKYFDEIYYIHDSSSDWSLEDFGVKANEIKNHIFGVT